VSLTPDSVGTTFPARTFSYGERETMLYALGIGAGADGDPADLPFLFEPRLIAFPSQATVIAWDDAWIDTLGLDQRMIVHGEQRITLHRPLPSAATITAQASLAEIVDKGSGRGALLYVETRIAEADSGAPLATLLSTVFARGDGGFGGKPTGGIAPHAIPDRDPDSHVETSVPLNQALIYRLSGDRNPLHVDPAFARAAGFDRPILHGLSTYGVAVRSIVKSALDNDAAAVEHVAARFSAPLYPGEAVRTLIWRDGAALTFRMIAVSDGRIVLDHGLVRLRA